jgi:hypothetical protein
MTIRIIFLLLAFFPHSADESVLNIPMFNEEDWACTSTDLVESGCEIEVRKI